MCFIILLHFYSQCFHNLPLPPSLCESMPYYGLGVYLSCLHRDWGRRSNFRTPKQKIEIISYYFDLLIITVFRRSKVKNNCVPSECVCKIYHKIETQKIVLIFWKMSISTFWKILQGFWNFLCSGKSLKSVKYQFRSSDHFPSYMHTGWKSRWRVLEVFRLWQILGRGTPLFFIFIKKLFVNILEREGPLLRPISPTHPLIPWFIYDCVLLFLKIK